MLIDLGPADAALCARIHTAAYPPGQGWDEKALYDLLVLPTTRGRITKDGNGFVLWQHGPDVGEILTIAVMPAARKQGLGHALLHAAEDIMRLDHLPRVLLDVADDNTAARALYDRAGYTRINTRPRYYAHGADAIVMEKSF